MPEATTTASVPEQQTLQVPVTAKELIEALVFAAEEPLSLEQIRKIYQESAVEERRDLKENEIETIISVLNDEFQQVHKPYRIVRIAGGYQFATMAEYAEWIGKLYKEQGRRKLSQSSLETLAIIAYRQPVIRPEIETIRGVDCDYVLGTLLEKKLITIVGRAPTPGRPLLYGTTEHFLKHFGLNSISDLPRPREIEELLADARYDTERRMLEAHEQADRAREDEPDFKSRLPHIPKQKAEMDASAAIVPKKPSRSLNVHRADEAQETAQQDRANVDVAEKTTERQPEDSETVDQAATQASTLDAAPESPVNPESTGQSPVDVPMDGIPVGTAPEATEESSETAIGPEMIEQEKPVVDEKALPLLDDNEKGNNPELAVAEEGHATEIITTELRLSETQETQTQERIDEVVSSPEEKSTFVELEQPEIVEENQGTRSQLEEPPTGLIQVDTSRSDERTEPAELNVDSTERLQDETESTFEEVSFEKHPEVASPPVEVTESFNEVTPPSVAPIVDEVREPIQTKSRWRQFKEKIQGFIRKVFG